MLHKNIQKILLSITLLLTIILVGFAFWIYQLDQEIVSRLASKRFLTPTEYYSAPEEFIVDMQIQESQLKDTLKRLKFRQRQIDQRFLPQDFMWEYGFENCQNILQVEIPTETQSCLIWQNSDAVSKQALLMNVENRVLQILSGTPLVSQTSAKLEAELFAQYLGTEPIFQRITALGDMPPACLNAVLSIEDNQFLEHAGISPTGILRAVVVNLIKGRASQGGSTITQQLVKNYFLTSEKTLKRKLIEFFMSIILEMRATKDEILETYLNIIYLGQDGAFQVRGYGAAAEYYFAKDLPQLELSECALLAAIVNSPGRYNPFTKPENALQRRELVLKKMLEYNRIAEAELTEANQKPLPQKNKINLSETAPYFIDAVQKQATEIGLDLSEKKIFTTLNLQAQVAAQRAVQSHLDYLEKNNKAIIKIKSQKHNLEGMLLSANPTTGHVMAVVGGRSFKMTQFNRAVDGHRQIGSIMKPMVFLTALNSETPEGELYQPDTLIRDEKFVHKFDRQNWSPENYNKEFLGDVTLSYALSHSLNAATAKLALDIGLDKVINTAELLGVTSTLKPLPSISLGSFELYPTEVLKMYSTLVQNGIRHELTFIDQVEDQQGQKLFQFKNTAEQTFPQEPTHKLVQILEKTNLEGTGASVTRSGFAHPSAGKTGTTSDNKDSWYAGFTQHHVAVVWVGYDKNISNGLTGASGALPIWIQYMKEFAAKYPPTPFILENSN